MKADLEQNKNNVYYKTCEKTYNERLKELINKNKVPLRWLKDNVKISDELVLDINSDYFEKHGRSDFAKMFYEKPSTLQKQNMVKIILYLPLCTQMNRILH